MAFSFLLYFFILFLSSGRLCGHWLNQMFESCLSPCVSNLEGKRGEESSLEKRRRIGDYPIACWSPATSLLWYIPRYIPYLYTRYLE